MGRVAAIVFLVVAVGLLAIPEAIGQDRSRCQQTSVATAAAKAEPPGTTAPVKLSAVKTRIPLSTKRGARTKDISIDTTSGQLTPGEQVLALFKGPLDNGDGGIDRSQLSAVATVNALNQLSVAVCVDTEQPTGIGAGVYDGSLVVGGPGIETTAIPVTVTLKSSWLTALVFSLIGLVLGLVLKMFSDLRKDPNTTVRDVGEYVGTTTFFSAICVGIVVVLYSLLVIYQRSASWGTGEDEFKLIATGIAVQITGMTITDFITPFVPKPGAAQGGAPPAPAAGGEPVPAG